MGTDIGTCSPSCTTRFTDGAFYYFTKGSPATAGPTDKKIYVAKLDATKPHEFWLRDAAYADTVTAATGTAKLDITGEAGKKDKYVHVANGSKVTHSTSSNNKIKVKHANGGTPKEFAADGIVMLYCSDATTAADCK